jgi:long-chain fatty acid transport protein
MSRTTANKPRRPTTYQRTPALLAAVAGLGVALAPGSAEASGFLGARFGADHGNPVGPNTFSIYFNPAAIAGAKGTQVSLDASLIYRLASYDRPASALSPNVPPSGTRPVPDDAEVRANSGKAKLGNVLALPFVGATSDLGTKIIHVGVASYIPFGGLATWNRNDNVDKSQTPGATDGPQRWFNISGQIISLYNTAAVSVTIPDTHLSFGVNGSVVLSQVRTARARNPDGSDDTRNANGTLKEGRALVDVSGKHIAAAVGVYWEAIPQKLALGASYSIAPGFGEMRLKGTLQTALGNQNAQTSDEVDFTQTLPDVMRIGGSYRINKSLEIRADAEYVTWSKFKRQCLMQTGGTCELNDDGSTVPKAKGDPAIIQVLDRRWRNAGGVRVGLSYFVSSETEIFGSAGGDTSAVPLETLDASFIDAFKLLGTLGVKQQLGQHFVLAGSYNHVYFLPSDSTYANTFNTLKGVSKQPNAGGTYNQQFMFLNVNGTLLFLSNTAGGPGLPPGYPRRPSSASTRAGTPPNAPFDSSATTSPGLAQPVISATTWSSSAGARAGFPDATRSATSRSRSSASPSIFVRPWGARITRSAAPNAAAYAAWCIARQAVALRGSNTASSLAPGCFARRARSVSSTAVGWWAKSSYTSTPPGEPSSSCRRPTPLKRGSDARSVSSGTP